MPHPAVVDLWRELGIPPDYATLRSLSPCVEAAEAQLVVIGTNPDGREVRLTAPAAAAWMRLRHAAACDRITLLPISGFRSIHRQTAIIREKLAGGQPVEDILRVVAAPGFSEHHTGRALDIGSPEHIELDEEFAQTTAFHWLERHGQRFGFSLSYPRGNPHRIAFEPWHWCWHD